MSCYLCAYLRPERPDTAQPLPAGSRVGANDPFGTCHRCSVWACSEHGTRYSWFECAICTPAQAAHAALTGQRLGDPATAQAHLIGALTSEALQQTAARAVDRVAADNEQPVEVRAELAARGIGEPNLVVNLAEVMRTLAGDRPGVRFLGGARGSEQVSFDVIGAAVRAQFADTPIAPATSFSATVIAGALVMAYALADPRYAAARAESRGSDSEPPLPAPWAVTYPTLLDPTLWMLGTAVAIGQR